MKHDFLLRYWVFSIMEYYPSGGLNDVVHTTNDIDNARWKAREARGDDVFIYDTHKGEYL